MIAVNACFCGLGSGLLALHTFAKSLPPSDGAYGTSVRELLRDPFVLSIWLLLVLFGTAVGFAVSLRLLWRVELWKAIPVVAVTTIVIAAASAPVAAPLSPLLGLLGGVLAMLWCNRRCRATDLSTAADAESWSR